MGINSYLPSASLFVVPFLLLVMPMRLYLGNNPRSIHVIQDTPPRRALVFTAAPGRPGQAIVDFIPTDQVNLHSLVKLSSRIIQGILGLISIDDDIFLAVVTSGKEVGNTRPSARTPETVSRIHDVAFFSLNSSIWDGAGQPSNEPPSSEIDTDYPSSSSPPQVFEHPCTPLTKILANECFYYSSKSNWDISSRLLHRLNRDSRSYDLSAFDERFIWNENIVRSLLDFRDRLDTLEKQEFDRCRFILLVIQGFVGVFTMALPAPPTDGAPTVATLALISRLSWKRAGTRFNTRGVDDDGNCANFVETETLFSTDQQCVSYVQVRGSVPIFWEQQGIQTFGHRIQLTRPQASQPAFERHFSHLADEYGQVHAVNLLGSKENEAILSNAYNHHLRSLGDAIGCTNYDFHAAVKFGGHDAVIREVPRIDSIKDNMNRFGFTMCDAQSDEIITEQRGVFRTNCLDCLDRTNFIQDNLSRQALIEYLSLIRREWLHAGALWTHHRELWAENGDYLSKIYAGTGALNTSFTRSGKRTLAGVLSDATKSVSRAYINNFQDKSKQTAIDMFLGNMNNQLPVTIYDPIHDSVREALKQRMAEYSTTKSITIFAGTWNLNGRPPTESLLPWLFPRSGLPEPDILAIGFQEIVPLTAQQIVQTDPEKRRIWERTLIDNLNCRPNKTTEYIILRSEQLVGTAIIVIVKAEIISSIRNVEAATRKTGLRGMSGNKGAAAVRLNYHDTSFCFVSAHLAAGHSNFEERNIDYRTVESDLHFLKGKTIASHDNIIWVADTNYRIDLENDVARSLSRERNFEVLASADQLTRMMSSGVAFAGYEEGPLLFEPTYRYDVGTDDYDTSEKMRIPAWTDRVLYKGSFLDLSSYSRAELRGSDHRPVFAIFRGIVRIIDHVKRAALSKMLLNSITTTGPSEKIEDKLAAMALTSAGSVETELPPPSSDESAWWVTPDNPEGIFVHEDDSFDSYGSGNPFDSLSESSLSLSSSPSSSYDELFASGLGFQEPITPVPAAENSASGIRRKPPPPPPPRSTKPT